MGDVWLKDPISDERLDELYEVFAERAATPTTGMKEDIDVMRALGELQERRTALRVVMDLKADRQSLEDWMLANRPVTGAAMIYTLQYLRSHAIESTMAQIGGRYYPARPIRAFLFGRLRAAWEVFRGRADAFTWPAGQ